MSPDYALASLLIETARAQHTTLRHSIWSGSFTLHMPVLRELIEQELNENFEGGDTALFIQTTCDDLWNSIAAVPHQHADPACHEMLSHLLAACIIANRFEYKVKRKADTLVRY